MAYLTLDGLSKTSDGIKILENISFSVEKGTLTLICGLNGSGKSTLLKCLKGLMKTDSGSVFLNGRKLERQSERMRIFGLVFQDTSLQTVGRTVERDIAFGLENQRKSTSEIRRITDNMITLFQLEDVRERDVKVLSGGERRRLSIASVLAMETEVLLLDEPLANLDYPSVKMVLSSLVRLRDAGITVIMVSHEAEKFLALTDNTIILKDGKVAGKGKSRDMTQELRRNMIYLPEAPYEDLSWL